MDKKVCMLTLMSVAASVFGANWDGIGGNYNGDYTNQLMWSTGTVPTDKDMVYFLKPGSYTVGLSSVVTNLTTEFRGTGSAAYNVNVALDSSARMVILTNLFVRGGTVSYPARVAFNGGAVDVLYSKQSGNGGLNDKYAELYLTNTVLTTGGQYFYVGPGANCSGNALVVGPGASYVGVQIVVGDNTTAYSNRVEVSGANSYLAISNNQIRVGLTGSWNSLTVTNGGQVTLLSIAAGTTLGGNSNRLYFVNGGLTTLGGNVIFGGKGSYNTTVFGAGSSLSARSGSGGTLYVGQDGAGSYNRASFVDGAAVTSFLPVTVGQTPTNVYNVLEVTGSSFINSNGIVTVGNYGSGNAMLVTGGSKFYAKSTVNCGYQSGAVSNSIVFADTAVAIDGDLYMGQTGGSYNTIALTNTSLALVGTTYIGNSGATGNVFIAGTGTSITSVRRFIVGYAATSRENEIRFENAEGVFGNGVAGYSSIGENGHANRLFIRGAAGRVVNTSAALYVGYYGSYNRMAIENGGRLLCRGLLIGDQTGVSNTAAITGSGSRIDSFDADIRLGGGSSTGSVLVVSDGAVVDSGNSGFGVNYAASTWGASLLVSNAVVLCTNNNFWARNDAFVGFAGSSSLLSVKACQLYDSSVLAFSIPLTGVQSTNAVIQIADSLTLGTPVLKIAAKEWANRYGGRITLLTYGGALTGSLTALAASAQLDSPALTVSVVGKSLVLSAPRRNGTLMCVY